ncbi:hypothetical protein [Halosolutus halophilus]|uniref:hypothetical protein n=1 Tax=Halosolutus halophilus TaxID=1552990 RepID=UPI00223513B8|nr:hypothetical protein [Halosolutus halophilus]
MSELTDRLLILVVAATALLVLITGWAGGLVEAVLGGVADTIVLGALGLLLLLVLLGIWQEFSTIE